MCVSICLSIHIDWCRFNPWVRKIPWKIPWTEESIGSQRVGHDWVHTHTHQLYCTLVFKNVSRNTGSENPTLQIQGEEGRSSEWVLLTYKAVWDYIPRLLFFIVNNFLNNGYDNILGEVSFDEVLFQEYTQLVTLNEFLQRPQNYDVVSWAVLPNQEVKWDSHFYFSSPLLWWLLKFCWTHLWGAKQS